MKRKLSVILCLSIFMLSVCPSSALGTDIDWTFVIDGEEIDCNPYDDSLGVDWLIGDDFVDFGITRWDPEFTLSSCTVSSSDPQVATAELIVNHYEEGLPINVGATEGLTVKVTPHNIGETTISVKGLLTVDEFQHDIDYNFYISVISPFMPLKIELVPSTTEILLRDRMPVIPYETILSELGGALIISIIGGAQGIAAAFVFGLICAAVTSTKTGKEIESVPNHISVALKITNPNYFDISDIRTKLSSEDFTFYTIPRMNTITDRIPEVGAGETVVRTYTIFPRIVYNNESYVANISAEATYDSDGEGESIETQAVLDDTIHVQSRLTSPSEYNTKPKFDGVSFVLSITYNAISAYVSSRFKAASSMLATGHVLFNTFYNDVRNYLYNHSAPAVEK